MKLYVLQVRGVDIKGGSAQCEIRRGRWRWSEASAARVGSEEMGGGRQVRESLTERNTAPAGARTCQSRFGRPRRPPWHASPACGPGVDSRCGLYVAAWPAPAAAPLADVCRGATLSLVLHNTVHAYTNH
jgi:hypothetical protein